MKNETYHLKISTSILSNIELLKEMFFRLNIKFKCVILPTKKKRFALISSPHVHKKSKEHFENIKYNRLFLLNINSEEQIKKLLIKIPNNLNIILKKMS